MRVLYFLRSLLAGIIFVFTTLFCSLFVLIQVFISPSRKIENFIMNTWAKFTLKSFGVKLIVSGTDNIPARSCLFLFTHTSFFDIFSMQAAYPDFRFGAKIELFSIPIFGPALLRTGALPISRSQKEEVFKVYEEARLRAARGEKFALAPEGGRTEGNMLMPFKAGPFVFAINSGMPLVPVIIKGANKVMSKGELLPNTKAWESVITIQYLPPIPVTDYTLKDRTRLQDVAYAEMKKYF